jgi:hypothetical protein
VAFYRLAGPWAVACLLSSCFGRLPEASGPPTARHLTVLSRSDPASISEHAITYQRRRVRLHGLIERVANSSCYRVTDFRLRVALFFTRTCNHFDTTLTSAQPASKNLISLGEADTSPGRLTGIRCNIVAIKRSCSRRRLGRVLAIDADKFRRAGLQPCA